MSRTDPLFFTDGLKTHSLTESDSDLAIRQILAAALAAVEPKAAVQRVVKRRANLLQIGGKNYDLATIARVLVIGAGKAGLPMAQALEAILDEFLSDGLVIVKEGYGGPTQTIEIAEAQHPLPDHRGVQAAARIFELLNDSQPDDLVIVLISGGGSALLTQPQDPIQLDELQSLTELLLASGADIEEINTLRKHIDRVKGGGLALAAAPAQVITLILSDVVGDPLDMIASGPTVPDPTTFEDALAILSRYELSAQVPMSIRNHLRAGQAGRVAETLKPGQPAARGLQHVLVGSNRQAAQAARAAAEKANFSSEILTLSLVGQARDAGRWLAETALTFGAVAEPYCLIAGGETTVLLSPQHGQGGRNQEMALAALPHLAGQARITLVTLATDGGDGPTDAAGAVVTGGSLARSRDLGLDPVDALERHDAYPFFEALGDLLKPGPTRTNVNDLAFLFIFPD